MSQRRRKTVGRRRQEVDEEEVCSQSQPGPSQLSQTQNSQTSPIKGLSAEEQQKYVSSIVKYILVADRHKSLIQRAQIVKHVNCNGKVLRSLMPVVKEVLETVFGYTLEEDSAKFYVHNTITNNIPHLKFSKSVKSRQVLLLLVLTHIFMTGEECKEASLWSFLKQLQIVKGDDFKNEYFGDIQKIVMEEFVKEQYISLSKIDGDDDNNLKLHKRVETHMPRYILEFVSKVYGNRSISSWVQQHKRMLEYENVENEED